MTTPTPRWTAETEELVYREIGYFLIQEGALSRLDDFAEHILTALADAGVLIPAGGETRQEYGWRSPRGTIMRGWSSSPPDVVRDVTVWPIEGQPNDNWPRYVGPWREVTDDPA